MIIQNINTNSSNSKLQTLQAKNSLQIQKPDPLNINKNKQSSSRIEKQQSLSNIKLQKKDTLKLFKPLQNQTLNTTNKFQITKSNSQPKIRTYKQQILRIPKVKQILQKDKFVYQSDIQKRLQLIGDVKNQNYTVQQIIQLKTLNKPVTQQKKKNKRHKTNYKIPLTRQNIQSLNKLIQNHIGHNQHFKNQEFIYLSEKDYKQPFDLKKLKFMDQINPLKKKYKEKFPDLKEEVLSKNKLLLQHVILNRNVKREMKLDQKKRKKEQAIKAGLDPQQLIKKPKVKLN